MDRPPRRCHLRRLGGARSRGHRRDRLAAVMEGKCTLFKRFAGLNAIPIVIDTNDADEIVDTIVRISPTFGAINLEDISAPRRFEIEDRVKAALDIPVMHDDQHGTAIVVLAALMNAAKVVGKDISDLKVVISGSGAAGVAVTKILHEAGVSDIVVLDSKGIVESGRDDLTPTKQAISDNSNPRGISGGVGTALDGADVFIGLSSGTVDPEPLAHMADDAIIFALSNPNPEVAPDVAAQYATVVATGRGRLPQPDQQRPRVPRSLPRRARRRRHVHHRGDEARRRQCDRGRSSATTSHPTTSCPVRSMNAWLPWWPPRSRRSRAGDRGMTAHD